MAMELFEKGTYMYSLMADYWVLNRKLLSIDAENLMQDDFWEYATKELEAFYQKYKTNYAKNQALKQKKWKKKKRLKLPSLGLRHRRKITGSHFGCLFLFVQKSLNQMLSDTLLARAFESAGRE